MPVPASINDLSTTAASNSPSGGENPFPDLDNHLRALASFIAQLRDGKLDASTVSAFMLTVLNDADAATARATLGAVGLTGDETVAGIKTFSSSPIVPTATAGDNTTKAASTAFVKTAADSAAAAVEAKVPGIGQTWQDVSGSRSIGGGPYTNGTAKPIQVNVATTAVAPTNQVTAFVGGVAVAHNGLSNGATATLSFVVGPGESYQLTATNTSVLYWAERR